MMAAVLTLLWRQVPSVHELTRVLAREDLLWCRAVKVSQQALSQRFWEFPAEPFERVFQDLLPVMASRWQARQHRPLPKSVEQALSSFERIWIADGSTLEALFRKLKSLESAQVGQLAGKMMVVMDLVTRLPVHLWVESNPYAHDTTFGERLKAQIKPRTLLILDRGFWDFHLFEDLMTQSAAFITRLKAKAALEVLQPLSKSPWHRDSVVRLGKGYQGNPILTLRLIEVRVGKQWHTYLTSVLDPEVLPPGVVADLYQRRWRIETLFQVVTENFEGEIQTLGYPPAALFSFCMALVAYNLLATVKAALRAVHGAGKVEAGLSWYYLVEDVQATYRGLSIAIEPDYWQQWRDFSTPQLAHHLLELAAQVNLKTFLKQPRSPKRKKPPLIVDRNHRHLSTQRLLKEKRAKS